MCATAHNFPKIGATFLATPGWLRQSVQLGAHMNANAMIVSDVLGQPEAWVNCISDKIVGLPDLRTATILDVFVSRNELTLYALGANGVEAVAVFVIENQDLREKIATAMEPGIQIRAALLAAI